MASRLTLGLPRRKAMIRKLSMVFGAIASLLAHGAAAQLPVVYPAKNQSVQQQSKDESECFAWAKQSTGIDPAAVQPAPAQSQGPGGERLRGAARGAVGGAIIGEIAGDDAGKGAGIGAVAGGMAGGRQSRIHRQQETAQAQSQHDQTLNTYYRAYGACMSGRGYSVQ
jgi:hypothetical protein